MLKELGWDSGNLRRIGKLHEHDPALNHELSRVDHSLT